MKVIDLNGNVHTWNLLGHTVDGNETRPRSELHIKVRNFLKEQFPTLQILEEVPLPGTKLSVDFYMPIKKMAIEAHGIQHYEYVPFFHGNTMGFIESKKRDRDKESWLLNNNIKLVVLSYKETVEDWLQKV